MGCAYVKKIEIKTKDIDLSGEITKPHCNESNNDINIALKKKSSEIINLKKFNFRNLDKSKNPNNENNENNNVNKKRISKSKSLNNMNEFKFSGPIISLLKNKVDNYQKKILSNKSITVNNSTNLNK